MLRIIGLWCRLLVSEGTDKRDHGANNRWSAIEPRKTKTNMTKCKQIGLNGYGQPVYRTVHPTHSARAGLSQRQAEDRFYGDGEASHLVVTDGYETCVGDSALRALGWTVVS